MIVPSEGGEDLEKALEPLIRQRERALGAKPPVFHVEPGTTAAQFLKDNGVERGLGRVASVPYYLLIARDPERIPFRFQMELNTEYVTGRLHFDRPDDYQRYAQSLVTYEGAADVPNRREVAFWAPERQVDPSTSLSAPSLVQPLHDQLAAELRFDKRLWRGEGDGNAVNRASKSELEALLSGARPPALLFTASHGLGYKQPRPEQAANQGALLTQEYVWGQPVDTSQYLGAADLAPDARLDGLVHSAFACFGAGTPKFDDFADPEQHAAVIAEKAFVAALPTKMLAQGALAFIGHVERAWGYSFLSSQQPAPHIPGLTPLEAFRRALRRISARPRVARPTRPRFAPFQQPARDNRVSHARRGRVSGRNR